MMFSPTFIWNTAYSSVLPDLYQDAVFLFLLEWQSQHFVETKIAMRNHTEIGCGFFFNIFKGDNIRGNPFGTQIEVLSFLYQYYCPARWYRFLFKLLKRFTPSDCFTLHCTMSYHKQFLLAELSSVLANNWLTEKVTWETYTEVPQH